MHGTGRGQKIQTDRKISPGTILAVYMTGSANHVYDYVLPVLIVGKHWNGTVQSLSGASEGNDGKAIYLISISIDISIALYTVYIYHT